MRVLIACEESGTMVDAFVKRWGDKADVYSCDLLPTSGKHPDRHIICDAIQLLKMDWDLAICHPSCTAIAVSGARWFEEKKRNGQWYMGVGFFLAMTAQDHIPFWAVENPVSVMSTIYRKPDCVVQPWMFGDMEQKTTCWWTHGLPPLKETNNVKAKMDALPKSERERVHYMSPGPERSRLRSKTYPGLAAACADQWGGVVLRALGEIV